MEFDFEIQHMLGPKHLAAEALSHMPANLSDIFEFNHKLLTHTADEALAINRKKSDEEVGL